MRLQRKDMQLITNIKMAPQEGGLDVWLNLLKGENSQCSRDFVEDFKMNLYSKEIYVLQKTNPYQRSNFTGLRL
jgi:hypothetical protein